MATDDLEARIRAVCTGLDGVDERLSHGTPSWFAGRQFATLWPDGHHGFGWPQLWCAAPAGAQEALVAAEPDRYFRPPYVGHRGWIGVRLDTGIDPAEVEDRCVEAYHCISPRRRA